ncbi:MAG: sulfatase [Rhodothermales bacterium]
MIRNGCFLLVALLMGLSLGACTPPAPDRPVNIVMIVIDDLGWMDTGVYGSPFYETPNIDRLAEEGTRFTQFYTASPVCSPTRASLMTGKHPARLRLTNWIGGEQNGLLTQAEYVRQLSLEEVTVGEAFREHGYATGYIGKWHLGAEPYLPAAQGFDFTFAVNQAGQPGSYFPPYENPNWPITNVPDLARDPEGAYLTDRLTDASLDFIDTNRDRPFFLVLSHYAVHTPLQAPPEAVQRYEAKAALLGPDEDANYESEREATTKLRQDHPTYAAMVESTDESVGRILRKLAELELDGRTVVVFLSDNGGLSTLMRRGFNQATANVPLRAGKGWLYEGGIRAPLIIRWPGAIDREAVVASPAMSTDLFPTLLAMAGLPARPEQHVDGTSLVGAMTGAAEAPHEALFWHFPHYHGSGNRPGGAVGIGDLKLVEWFEDGAVELYDLSTDLSERRDLARERPDEAARLLAALRAWREEVGANMPTPR